MSVAYKLTNEDLARHLHAIYEDLASKRDYVISEDMKAFNPNNRHGRLMMEVIGKVRPLFVSPPDPTDENFNRCFLAVLPAVITAEYESRRSKETISEIAAIFAEAAVRHMK
jgi:hypothetical protein